LGSDAVAPLTDLLGDPALRQKAALGLVTLGDAGGLRAVLRLAESGDEASQLKALFGLYAFARFERTAEAFQELHRLAAESDFASVREMGTGLSNGLDQIVAERISTLRRLVAWLDCDDKSKRLEAVIELKALDQASIGTLVAMAREYTGPPSPPGRPVFAQGPVAALGMVGAPALEQVVEAMRHGDAETQHKMANALMIMDHYGLREAGEALRAYGPELSDGVTRVAVNLYLK